MSILIAYKKGDTVYMGTDTRTIIDDRKKNDICKCNYKIQRQENGMLVGITAETLTRQTIFAYSEIFTLDKKGELTRKHIIKEIVPKLKNLLDNEELMVQKEGELPYMTGQILLAYKGELYEICNNFCVYKYETFQALGPVANDALFTLANIKDTDNIEQKMIRALDVVAKHSQYVGSPYLLANTNSQEEKLIRRNDV